jgi:uncharacterized membrane protein YdbT with pleckstrin-like domain
MQQHKKDRVRKRISITSENEQVIAVERQFPIVLRRALIYGLLIVLVAIIPWVIAFGTMASWLDIAYIWMAICAGVLFMYWLRSWVGWHYSVYVLTNQRLMVVKQGGFFSRDVADLALHNIQNVNYSIKGMQAAMFGFGTLSIDTMSGAGSLRLRYVHKPARFQKLIMAAVHKSNPVSDKKGSTKDAEQGNI